MAKGISLHIGLNYVDENCYGGWRGELDACENDARDMFAIAQSRGYDATLLLTEAASTQAFVDHMESSAAALEPGDMYLLSFAGHGGQVRDVNGDETDDRKDETWCFYDRQHLDDERVYLWSKFRPGVRIVVFSDSCHSGSTHRSASSEEENIEMFGVPAPKSRNLPDEALAKAYRALAEKYNTIQMDLAAKQFKVEVPVRLLSGCQDDQRSVEVGSNGVFTARVKEVWADGAFSGNFDEFHKKIIENMPSKQTPNHRVDFAVSEAFDRLGPFSLD